MARKEKKQEDLALGVIVKLHLKLDQSQQQSLSAFFKHMDLKKTKAERRFLLFQWTKSTLKEESRSKPFGLKPSYTAEKKHLGNLKLMPAFEAERVCHKLRQTAPELVNYCEPDRLLQPQSRLPSLTLSTAIIQNPLYRSGFEQDLNIPTFAGMTNEVKFSNPIGTNQKTVQIEGQDTVLHLVDLRPIFKKEIENTEAGFQEECLHCKENSFHSHIKNIKKIWNVRTCGIVSDSQELITMEEEKATLSDFWAQEMTGTDLLREEVKTVPPLKKKSFIAVLESEKPIFENEKENPDYKPHVRFVENLISHEGPQAVLPELTREQIFFVQADKSSDYVFEDSNEQKILAAASPSFINISMEWAKHNEIVYKKLKSLSPPSVVVTSTGNKFPSR